MASRPATTDDLQHLRVLSVCYYVLAGLSAVCATVPVIHLLVGVAIVGGQFPLQPQPPQAPPPQQPFPPVQPAPQPPAPFPPALFGWFFIVIAAVAIVFGWLYAVGMAAAGYLLARHRRHTFCLVMAGFACLNQPLGMVLGVFTFIVLLRPSVKELFARAAGRVGLDPPYAEPAD